MRGSHDPFGPLFPCFSLSSCNIAHGNSFLHALMPSYSEWISSLQGQTTSNTQLNKSMDDQEVVKARTVPEILNHLALANSMYASKNYPIFSVIFVNFF